MHHVSDISAVGLQSLTQMPPNEQSWYACSPQEMIRSDSQLAL